MAAIIRRQADDLPHEMTTTAFELPGFRIVRSLGVVRGVTVRSRNIFGSIWGSLQTIRGGNIGMFTELAERARRQAFETMLHQAHEAGANAVIAVRYDGTEMMSGVTEVRCYGTAVEVESIREKHGETPGETTQRETRRDTRCLHANARHGGFPCASPSVSRVPSEFLLCSFTGGLKSKRLQLSAMFVVRRALSAQNLSDSQTSRPSPPARPEYPRGRRVRGSEIDKDGMWPQDRGPASLDLLGDDLIDSRRAGLDRHKRHLGQGQSWNRTKWFSKAYPG